jgi:hypothetical protein
MSCHVFKSVLLAKAGKVARPAENFRSELENVVSTAMCVTVRYIGLTKQSNMLHHALPVCTLPADTCHVKYTNVGGCQGRQGGAIG